MNLIENIRENAKKVHKRIVLPEGLEKRTLIAADYVVGNRMAEIILLGDPLKISDETEKLHLKNLKNVKIVDPLNLVNKDAYVERMVEI